jgi:hypothetical protein
VSVRFAPVVAATLREVAGFADMRIGQVFDAAIERAVATARGKKVDRLPLGLDPGQPEQLAGADADKTETISPCVDATLYEALVDLHPDAAPTTVVHDACVRLLADLNYRIA